MKTLIFSAMALAMALSVTLNAHATCAARSGGGLKAKADYSRQLPDDGGKSSAQQAQSAARTRGADGRNKR